MRKVSLIAALALAACGTTMQGGESVNGVSLTATPTATRDSIVLTLANGSAQRVGYNLCTHGVEQRAGSSWQALPSDRICTMELRTLEPGANATFTTTLPAGASSGDYRFVTGVEMPMGGSRQSVASNVVRIAP